MTKQLINIPEKAKSKEADKENERYPVQIVKTGKRITVKNVKDAVTEINPDISSMDGRG